MISRNRITLAAVGVTTLTLLGIGYVRMANAQGQDGGPPPPQGFGRPGGQGQPGFPGGPQGFGGGPGFGGGFGGGAAITANNQYVFVLRGNRLYKFSTNDLSLIGDKELPVPQQPGLGGRGGSLGGPPGGPGRPGPDGSPQSSTDPTTLATPEVRSSK